MKARKKPVIIDFFEITTNYLTANELNTIKQWANSFEHSSFESWFIVEANHTLLVKTLEGTSYTISSDDVIIRGVFNEFYPCKKSIFYATYEILDDETQRNR